MPKESDEMERTACCARLCMLVVGWSEDKRSQGRRLVSTLWWMTRGEHPCSRQGLPVVQLASDLLRVRVDAVPYLSLIHQRPLLTVVCMYLMYLGMYRLQGQIHHSIADDGFIHFLGCLLCFH